MQELKPVTLLNVHAYAEKSLAAGSTLHFQLSSTVPTALSIVRLGWDTSAPTRDWVVAELGGLNAAPRVIKPGSYIDVPNALPDAYSTQMTLECWVRPWQHRWQGLISQYTYPTQCGFGLFLDAIGRPVAYFGNGTAFNSTWLFAPPRVAALPLRQWAHVAVRFSSGAVTIFVNGSPVAKTSLKIGSLRPGTAPLRLGAYGENGLTDYTLQGDIAMPVIYSTALSNDAVNTRYQTRPPTVPVGNVLGCWPLVEESGVNVGDASGQNRPGTIINRGTWMIGGPFFNSNPTPDQPFLLDSYNPDPVSDGTRGHALRLSADDLYDCGWPETTAYRYTIPEDLPPGVYSGRLSYITDPTDPVYPKQSKIYDTVFIVRRPSSRPAARILVLCNTNTWLAYNTPFPKNPWATQGWNTGGPGVSLPNTPAYSMYADHTSTAAAYQVGTKLPWSAFPYMEYEPPSGYGHLLRAERPLHAWLEQNGYDYDVASDFDLHQNAGLLTAYKVVVLNGHSEYWSAQGYNALRQYLEGGGRVFVASGNTMFWRVSYDAAGDVMECRKLETLATVPQADRMGGRPTASVGELYHSHDGSRGGLLRESGFPQFGARLPAWKVIGVESVGFGGVPGSFKVKASGHAFFTSPELLGVANESPLGVGGAYHEWDVRLSQVPGTGKPTLGAGEDPVQLASASTPPSGPQLCDYQCNRTFTTGTYSEIIDWQRPSGGRVFAAGAIAIGSKLASDPKLGALARNVLHHFGVKQRLNLFVVGSTGRVRSRWWDGASWGPAAEAWDDSIGGQLQGPIQAVYWSPNVISILGVSTTGSLLYRYTDNLAWKPDAGFLSYAGSLVGRPAAVGIGRNKLYVYARDTSGIIQARWWDPNPGGWQPMGLTTMASDPAAAVFQGRRIALCAIGTNNRLYYRTWNGAAWDPASGWSDFGGDFSFAPALVAWGGKKLNIFAINRINGRMATKHFDGSAWDLTWYDLGGSFASRPVAVARGVDELSIFAVSTDGKMKGKRLNSSGWLPDQLTWTDLGGSFVGEPTATTWRGNHVSVMGVSSTGTVQYKWTPDGGATWFPSATAWDDITGALVGARSSPMLLNWIGS